MQTGFHFHLFLQRGSLAFHQRLLLRKLPPLALGLLELELRLQGVARRLNRAAGVQARNHVPLRDRLTLGDVEIRKFTVDGRVEAAHLRFGRKRALRTHDHVRAPEKRPEQTGDHEPDHKEHERARKPHWLCSQDRDTFGAVIFQRLGERLKVNFPLHCPCLRSG